MICGLKILARNIQGRKMFLAFVFVIEKEKSEDRNQTSTLLSNFNIGNVSFFFEPTKFLYFFKKDLYW